MRAARLACQGAGGRASWYAAATKPEVAARNAARSAQAGVVNNPFLRTEADELLGQATLLREIFGSLHFRQITVDPTWMTPAVVQLAHDNEILSHCRKPGPHVRGCWVLDLLLGKE
jgi:hypothetical protein